MIAALRHLIAASCASSLLFANSLAAQGAVAGRITLTDQVTPVEGVIVHLVGTRHGASTDSLGAFTIRAAPAGRHVLEARSPLYPTDQRVVVVEDGRTTTLDLVLAPGPRELAAVTVVGAEADALARIPGAAAAINERMLRAQQPLSANEVLRTVSGVHIQEEEGAGLRANIGIRGLDPDRSRSVLVLEDGVPVALAPYGEPEMYYSPPIDRMARIEVIKGSGSILFGPQTIGGVVNYVTAEPTALTRRRLDVRGGGGGQRFALVQVGGAQDGARGHISAFRRSADDFNGLFYDVGDVTGKVGFRTAIGDLSAKVSVYTEGSNSTYVGLTDSLYRAAPFEHPSPSDRLALSRQSLTLAHAVALGPATLRTTAYAYHTTRDWTRRDYTYGPTRSTLVFANTTGSRNRSFDVAGVEPRLRTLWSVGGITSDLDVGARLHVESARDRFLLGTIDGAPTTVRDDEVRRGEAVSAWVQNGFALHPTFTVTPGVRLEHFRFERHITRARVRRSDGVTTTRQIEDVDIRSGDTVGEVIPGIGLTWSPRALVTVFAGAHRGFAPPRTKDALIYSDPTLAPDEQVPDPVSLQLDAERSWNLEVGTRLTPRPYLQLEATAFLLDFTNQIIEPSLSSGTASDAALANQGATRHRGVEMGATFDLGKFAGRPYLLSLAGTYTLSIAEFSRDRFLQNGSDTVNVRGNALPYSPRQRAHASLTFEPTAGPQLRLDAVFVGAQFSDNFETAAGSQLRLDAVFVGAQFSDNFETAAGSANGRIGRIPAQQVIDASLRLPLGVLGDAELVAAAKNVLDRTYIASRRPEGIKVGLPRHLSLGLSWDF
ncbi:MAG: TonB-dependent receptor [Gemmatimonadaceae bacterium]